MKTNIFLKISLIFLLAFVAGEGWGQIVAWQLYGAAGNEASINASTLDVNLNTSTLSRGAGLNVSALVNTFGSTNYTASGSKANAISASKFQIFTINAKSGYKVSLSTLDVRFRRSSTGPNAFRWQYSIDGTNFTDIGSSDISYTSTTTGGDAQTQLDLSGLADLQNVLNSTTITIRLLGWGASATTGTFAIGRSLTSGASDYSLAIGGTVDVASSSSISSNIIRNTGFSEPTNIAYASYQSTDIINDANSIEVAKFDIQDGGGSADGDALTTSLTAITFTVSNVSNLRRLALYDGTTEIAEIAAASPAVFSGLSGLAASDDGSKTFIIRASFLATVTDNQQISFTVSSATADGAGSTFAAADAGAAASLTTGDANRIEVTATKLDFTTATSTTVCPVTNFPTPPVVTARDANNNTDVDFTNTVTITNSGTLSMTNFTMSAVAGVANFSTLQFTQGGSVTLSTTNGGGLTNAAATASITIAASDVTGEGATPGNTQVSVAWSNPSCYDQIMIVAKTSTISGTPTGDGTSYTANSLSFTDGANTTFDGTGKVVYKGTSSPQVITSLTNGTLYYFRIYTRKGTVWNAGVEVSATPVSAGIWSNPITGTNPNTSNPYTTGDTRDVNITVSGIGRGSGNSGSNANDRYNAQSWSTGAIDMNDYYYFTLTPNSGYQINLTNFVYTSQVSSGSPSFAIRSSLDGYTANIGSPNSTGTTIDLSGASYQDLISAITFRFYGYNFAASTTTFSINDFTFNGTVIPIPVGYSIVSAVSSSEANTISSIENTPNIIYNTEGTQVWQFDLYDGNGTDDDADALPTIYTRLTFTQGTSNTVNNWLQAIQSIKFFEDANSSPIDGNLTINTSSIVFTPTTPISVTDGAASKKQISIRLSLKNPLPINYDNTYFQFKLIKSNVLTETSATSSLLTDFTVNSDGTKNKIFVNKTQLTFKSAPTIVPLNTNFIISVAATDANNNIDLDATDNITVAKFSGTGAVSATSGLTKALSAGIYTWSDVQYSVEDIFVLQATAGGLTTGYSNNIQCVDAGSNATTLVKWDFPLTTDNQYADGGISLNYDAVTQTNSKPISGPSGLSYNNSGVTTRCASVTGWDGGSGTKYWQVYFATTGYAQIKVSSKQKSSGKAPKNWKMQYKIGAGGTWTDVTSGTVTVADDWITGVKTDIDLPSGCDEQAAVYVRWIMTSNTSVDNGTVLNPGVSRIDDIVVTGVSLNSLSTGTISGSPFCITSTTGIAVDVPFTSVGTYNSGNIYSAQLSNSSGSFSNPVEIGTLSSTSNSGTINATIPAATVSGTGYRIRVVASNPVKNGSDNGVNIIIILNTPDVSNFNALASSGQVTLGWNNPAGCYDDIMIIGKATSTVTATPTGDGTSYVDNLVFGTSGTDANLPSNEYCVYKGLTSGQIITGLTNDVTYYFKIFVRKGSDWSLGIELSAVPGTSQVGDYKSTGAGGIWSASGTWLKFNGTTWAASGDYPDDVTKNVTIVSGSIVTVTTAGSPPYDVKNLTVENGGKLFADVLPMTGCPSSCSYNNRYVSLYGNIRCDGIIGNGSTPDGVSFNIEGANVTISGTGQFDASRIRKNYVTNATTNLIIAMNINLRWNASSGTQIYNNGSAACNFNIIVNNGSTLNLVASTGASGNASIDGTFGTNGTNLGGTWTINGTMNIPGILYATTNNTDASAKPCTWIIGNGGVVNCNQVNCDASVGANSSHTIRILDGGKLNLNTNNGFYNFSSTNNVYDFQDGSTVEYSSPSGTQVVKATIPGVFEYSNLLISTDGGTKQLAEDITVKRNLSITGGVLDPNNYDISVGKNWSNFGTDGFTEGTTSTVYFNGANDQEIYCPDGEDFYNLDFSGAGIKTIYNNITSHNVVINTGSGAFNANDNDISVSGNWSNYDTDGFTEGTVASVTFNGTAAQSITCPNDDDFYKLIISNTSTGVTLNNSVNIAENLSFVSGVIITGTNMVNVSNTSIDAISGGVTNGIDKYIEGRLQWNTVAGVYTFPVGYSGYDAQGFDFTVNTGNGNVLAYLEPRNQNPLYAFAYCDLESNPGGGTVNAGSGSVGYDGVLDKVIFTNSPLQWNITNPGAGVSIYDVTFYPNGSQDIASVTTVNGLSVQYIMKNGEPGDDNIGVAFGDALPSFAANGFYACPNGNTLTSLTTFSKFTKHGAPAVDAILPIELLIFEAYLNNKVVDLDWSTASEINNDYFTIEKSNDGVNFESFAKVDGAGNSNVILNYEYTDQLQTSNFKLQTIYYYRLKQTDFDGKYSYSNIVSVYIENQEIIQNLWFNKDDNQINIEINSINSSEYTITAYDICGKQIIAKKAFIDGKMNLKINTDNIPSGIYTISIISDYCNFNKKVVIITK